MSEDSSLLTVDDVSERLSISKWRVYELARTGMIRSVRLGRTVRFDPRELESFIQRGGTRPRDITDTE